MNPSGNFGELIAPGFHWRYEGELLHREQSPYQLVEVWKTPHFGNLLTLDGCVMTSDADEFIYHEMLVHPTLVSRESTGAVLIVGGGDGGALRRVLEHPVEHVVQCDIDEAVTRVTREFLPCVPGEALDDPRATVMFDDGAAHVRANPGTYDVVIIDSTDPVGPAEVLATAEFYSDCRNALKPGGSLVAQSGSPMFQVPEFSKTVGSMRKAFGETDVYSASIPTYPGVFWCFATAGESIRCAADVAGSRVHDRKLDLRYYTPELHNAAFALPAYVRDLLAE